MFLQWFSSSHPLLVLIMHAKDLFNWYFHFVFHLHFLILMTCHLYMTLLTPLLLATVEDVYEALISLDVEKSPKFLPEVVLKLFVSHFIICFHFHCIMLPYLTVGKSTKLCLSLKLAITILQTIIAQFPCYLTHPKF